VGIGGKGKGREGRGKEGKGRKVETSVAAYTPDLLCVTVCIEGEYSYARCSLFN